MAVYIPQMTPSLYHASIILARRGIQIADRLCDRVSDILYPAPTSADLSQIPQGVTLWGGNLPELPGIRTVDFLKDPWYLAENAAITARCAIRLAEPIEGPVLILGWGRIGKCLGKYLTDQRIQVTIAARKDADLAIMEAMGYDTLPINEVYHHVHEFSILFNTVPAMLLPQLELQEGCRAYELASQPGMGGSGIIDARGLPGKFAPAEQGALIAKTFFRLKDREV